MADLALDEVPRYLPSAHGGDGKLALAHLHQHRSFSWNFCGNRRRSFAFFSDSVIRHMQVAAQPLVFVSFFFMNVSGVAHRRPPTNLSSLPKVPFSLRFLKMFTYLAWYQYQVRAVHSWFQQDGTFKKWLSIPPVIAVCRNCRGIA